MQERLNGHLLVSYRGKLLTPEDAPPLAASLRASATSPVAPAETWLPEDECSLYPRPKSPPGPLAGEPIWYEDAGKKRLHRDLVRAGMERARLQGKHIGRPRVTERLGFPTGLAAVTERLDLGLISRWGAAKELAIGYATLKRLLDARWQPVHQSTDHLPQTLIMAASPNEAND